MAAKFSNGTIVRFKPPKGGGSPGGKAKVVSSVAAGSTFVYTITPINVGGKQTVKGLLERKLKTYVTNKSFGS